jgi:hypothetical protein
MARLPATPARRTARKGAAMRKLALLTGIVATVLAAPLSPAQAADFSVDLRANPLLMIGGDPLLGLSLRLNAGLGEGGSGFGLRGEFGRVFLGLDALYRFNVGDGNARVVVGAGVSTLNVIISPLPDGTVLPIYARGTIGFEYLVAPSVALGIDAVPGFRVNPQVASGGGGGGGMDFSSLEAGLTLLNFGLYVSYRF